MNRENREIVAALRMEFQAMQCSRPLKIESERKLSERLSVGRQRIREVINELVAEGLLIKYEGKGTYISPVVKSGFVNLICSPEIKPNDPFYNRLLMELTTYAAKHCVNLISLTLDSLDNGMPSSPMVLIGRFDEEVLQKIQSVFKHIISFENYPERDDFTQIYFDHYRIGMNAAKLIASYGHKKVIHAAGPEKYASAYYRKSGFLRGARKYGLEPLVLESKMNFRGGCELATRVEELIRTKKCTALFAANDWIAIGLIQALKLKNIDIPGQLSVVGVDNIPLAGEMTPELTTYSLDANAMIAECFALLDAVEMNGGLWNFKKVILQPTLITRDTLTARLN